MLMTSPSATVYEADIDQIEEAPIGDRAAGLRYLDRGSGVLYVSEKYAVAGHLCACGCGNKVITPLRPEEWSFTEHNGLPSLWPSIGNWQLERRV